MEKKGVLPLGMCHHQMVQELALSALSSKGYVPHDKSGVDPKEQDMDRFGRAVNLVSSILNQQ